ncbi:MAG: TIGR00730 family Rossman fold protein [Clostridia bacterium]|nr:TIGR00730 family Rossman fold protein [Clostridia bacterium]
MPKRFYACVYGGASEKIAPIHKEKVQLLGSLLAKNGFNLVYGAGSTGCMGAIARGVEGKGGYVLGVSPDFISEFEEIYDCDNTIMVDTMAERKTIMEKHADIFFVVPGGMGTMDEFFQVLTLKYLKRIDVPIVIVNTLGFYDVLLKLIESLVEQNAVTKEIYTMFEVINDVEEKKIEELLTRVRN